MKTQEDWYKIEGVVKLYVANLAHPAIVNCVLNKDAFCTLVCNLTWGQPWVPSDFEDGEKDTFGQAVWHEASVAWDAKGFKPHEVAVVVLHGHATFFEGKDSVNHALRHWIALQEGNKAPSVMGYPLSDAAQAEWSKAHGNPFVVYRGTLSGDMNVVYDGKLGG